MWTPKPIKNKNPYMDGGPQHRHGQKSETRVVEAVGGTEVMASGAMEHSKSDGILGCFRLECKSTVQASISLKHEWLIKIREEALETNRMPILTISFVDKQGEPREAGDWALIPAYLLAEFEAYMRRENE